MMRSQGSFQATHRSLEPGMACSRGSGLIQDSTQQPLIMKGQCVAVGRQRELAVPAFHSCPGPEAIHVHEVMQTHPPRAGRSSPFYSLVALCWVRINTEDMGS